MKTLNQVLKSNHLSKDRGFTILELLVVVIVTGILGAIALPNLFANVGKAREAEAKQTLSAIGFAQQGYHFETGIFAGSYAEMGIAVSEIFYRFNLQSATVSETITNAIPKNFGNDPYRVYSMGLYYDNGSFFMILCQAANPTVTTNAPNVQTGICSDGGKNIQ